MSFAKNFFIGLFSFLLIVSLSILIISASFMLTINKGTLEKLVRNSIGPFVEDQIGQSFSIISPEEMASQHSYAKSICTTSEFYIIGQQGNDTITLDCKDVLDSTQQQFTNAMKFAIKEYTMDSISKSLDDAVKNLNYIGYIFWVSVILSVIFFVAIILTTWSFPFRTFGAIGLITGSPFILLLISQPFIAQLIEDQIQKTIPSEVYQQLSDSLIQAITSLISGLFLDMVIGFAVVFFVGLILLIIGLLIRKKKPQNPPQQFLPSPPVFVQPQQFARPIATFKNPR